MYKRKGIIWLLMLCVSILVSMPIQAGTGVKPSVKITFENMNPFQFLFLIALPHFLQKVISV